MGFLQFGAHFSGCGLATSTACFHVVKRAAENGFAADDRSVSGDGRNSRCSTLEEFSQDCDWVSVIAVLEKCDDRRGRVRASCAAHGDGSKLSSQLVQNRDLSTLMNAERRECEIIRTLTSDQALWNAVFTCGRVKYQITQTQNNVCAPARITATELWPTATSRGTKSSCVAFIMMASQRDQFFILKSPIPRMTPMMRYPTDSASNRGHWSG